MKKKIEFIKFKKRILAIIVKKNYYQNTKKRIEFFTQNNFNIQFGVLSHPTNYIINPHLHIKKKIKRKINTSEVLYVLAGKIRVDF